jgi:hypothetical protein
MASVSFDVLEILAMMAAFAGAMYLGRACREKACSFYPNEPYTVMYSALLIAAAFAVVYYDIMVVFLSSLIITAAAGYSVGYPLGSFSTRGVVEVSFGENEVNIKAYTISYYYNHKLKKRCIADFPHQKFRMKCRRLFRDIHETLDISDKVQVRTRMSVNNKYYEAKTSGGMTYVLKKEKMTMQRGKKTIEYLHYKYVPADITQLGPYDFYFRTELYTVALDIANEADALRLKAEIECKRSAAEGGATIIQAITKLDPSDAAASILELKEFVMSEAKTTAAAAAANSASAAAAENKEKPKRWWQLWRRKK